MNHAGLKKEARARETAFVEIRGLPRTGGVGF